MPWQEAAPGTIGQDAQGNYQVQIGGQWIPAPKGSVGQDSAGKYQFNTDSLGSAAKTPAAPNPSAAPSTGSAGGDRAVAPAAGFNRGVAGVLGLPGDTLLNLRDLGAAGLGFAQSAITGKPPSEAFDPVDRSNVWGSSASIERGLNNLGVATAPNNPNDPIQRYGAAAGAAVPGAVAGGPMATARAALGGVAGQVVADQGGGAAAQILAQTLSNKTGISDAAKAYAASRLQALEANAAPRVQSAVANAQEVAPGQQTVTQTTASPFLAKLGQGAAGAKTVNASANVVDQLTKGLTDQAKAIAPLGVSNPEVAAKVQDVLSQKDQELASRADAVYTSGRASVAKQDGTVQTPNTIQAVDQMLAEAQNPKNLAPPTVTKRLQALVDTLRPQVDPATGVPAAGGASWGDFYDLRKQINTLFDEVPKDQITPAMDQTFARLKAGYYADLNAAPAGPAKDTTTKANQIYQGIMDEREQMHNSVVASVLGKDGKTAISNPDQVMDRLVGLPPAAQKYVRQILETYSPDTLEALRAYAINKHVEAAARPTRAAATSETDPAKLSPGKLADSGLFTDEQAAELQKRQDALNVAMNNLPQKGAPVAEVDPQSVGRLVGGGFNPTFLAGAASRVLTAGKLETWLNTPEGRNNLLGVQPAGGTATPKYSKDVQSVVKLYQSALAAQVASDRQRAQQPQAGQPGAQAPTPPAQ
jgi:hypothetical protein